MGLVLSSYFFSAPKSGELLKVNVEFERVKMVFMNVYPLTVALERYGLLGVFEKMNSEKPCLKQEPP